MEPRGRAADLEAILAHSSWVRAFAARLVRDPGEADDLAQETLLAARARAPEEREGLRPWLARVLRNLAARGRRDRARAAWRERAVARPEALPGADETVANDELRALVGEALVAIPEPFRSTLILRYFGGLDANEIARREAIAPATVRSRVKRGLELVREELDRRHGNREAWSALFVRLLDWKHVGVATGATIAGGWIAMNAGWKIAAAAAAVVLTLSIGWWAVERNSPLSPAPEALARSQPAALEALEPAKPVANDAQPASARERVSSAANSAAKPAVAAEASEMVLEARTVDDAKRPIEGVSMEIPGFVQRGTSDAEGRLRLAFPGKQGFESRAWFKKKGWATRIVETLVKEGETVRLGDVVLEQACVITGHLEDPSGKHLGGNALVGPADVPVKDPERVRTLGPGYTVEGPIATTVIASWVDGTFTIDNAAPGVMRVWGLAEGHAWTSTEPFELHAGERRDGVVLKLEPLETRDLISGRVLDPTGKPVDNAIIMAAFEWTEGSTSRDEDTRPDGSFSFVVQARVPHELRIMDRQNRWSPLVLSPVQPGTTDLVARFEEPRWIELSVRTRGGEPVTKYEADLRQAEMLTRGIDLGPISTAPLHESHAGGVARLRLPNTSFRIHVDAPGHDLAELGPFEPRSAPARLEVELEKLPGVCGRVTHASAEDGPIEVELLRAQSNTWKNGYRVLYGGWPNATARAEADGSFCLDLRESGRYWIRAFVAEGRKHRTLAELGPLDLDARRGAADLELACGNGGTIEGLVLVQKGENAAGRIVAFNHGDGEPFTLRTDGEGRFRAEDLSPGHWQVLSAPEELTGLRTTWGSTAELEPPSDESLWTCTVRAGQTTHVELDLRQEHSGTLDGHFDCAGGSCAGWTVALREIGALRSDGGVTLSSTLESEGRFHFEFPRGGKYALTFTAPGEPGRTLALQHYLHLDSGANSWEKRVAFTSLSGSGLPPEPPEGMVFEYRAEGEFEAHCRIVPDAQGKFALPLVLAGKGSIARYQNESGTGVTWTGLATFEAVEGQPASVTLP